VLAQAIGVDRNADSRALLPMHFPHRSLVSQFTYPTRHTRGVGPLIDLAVVSRMLDAFVDVLLRKHCAREKAVSVIKFHLVGKGVARSKVVPVP
jgi:hypothetical protein